VLCSSELGSISEFAEIGVGIYEAQVLTPHQAEAVVKGAIKNDAWQRATVFREGKSDLVDTESRNAHVLYRRSAVDLFAEVGSHLVRQTRFVALALAPEPHVFSDLQIVRYAAGGLFRTHRDNSLYRRGRVVTVLCYLNAEFTGGRLRFPELHLTYAPRAGYCIVFPSTLLHAAERVRRGCKYVLTGWYTSVATDRTGLLDPSKKQDDLGQIAVTDV
jgi:predicted 2-oxoglutarate/Fe(II)-dependent dioxygenase YbiX